MRKGVYLDPIFRFSPLLLKREKMFLGIFLCNCLSINYASFGEKKKRKEKKKYRLRHFHAKHKLALLLNGTKLVLVAISKQNNFFFFFFFFNLKM